MPKWWTSIPPPSPEEEVGRKHWTKHTFFWVGQESSSFRRFRLQIRSSWSEVVQSSAGSIEGCCGSLWICEAEKGQSKETQGRWLYLQEIWPQTRKLWIACIIRLPCPALSNGGWTCFWIIFVSLDIGPYCALSSMSPLRLPEPTAALLASSKTDASHKLGVSWCLPKMILWYIVCDCVCCVCLAITVFVPFHYSYYLPFDFQHRFVFYISIL